MYKKILVPVDETKQSYSAVSLAGLIGAATGASLTLFHVRKPSPEVVTDMVTQDRLLELPGIEKERRIFEHCNKILQDSGVVGDNRSMESGNVAEAIVRECQTGHYDAIVMGHRGHKHLKQLLMGSIAHGVLAESQCVTIMLHVPGEER